jgi:hypothetical protein
MSNVRRHGNAYFMKTFEHPDEESTVHRAHPWTVAISDPNHRYYDLKTEPGLIRSSLEDFIPWSHLAAIETFYAFLEWLNGADSLLESNDCGTRGPRPNRNENFPKALECTARLMILYRTLPNNTLSGGVKWLADATRHYLLAIDPMFEWGVVGTTLKPTTYVTLPGTEVEQAGYQLMLTFWAWGDTEDEVMANLGRTFTNAQVALKEVCREVSESTAGRNDA